MIIAAANYILVGTKSMPQFTRKPALHLTSLTWLLFDKNVGPFV